MSAGAGGSWSPAELLPKNLPLDACSLSPSPHLSPIFFLPAFACEAPWGRDRSALQNPASSEEHETRGAASGQWPLSFGKLSSSWSAYKKEEENAHRVASIFIGHAP